MGRPGQPDFGLVCLPPGNSFPIPVADGDEANYDLDRYNNLKASRRVLVR